VSGRSSSPPPTAVRPSVRPRSSPPASRQLRPVVSRPSSPPSAGSAPYSTLAPSASLQHWKHRPLRTSLHLPTLTAVVHGSIPHFIEAPAAVQAPATGFQQSKPGTSSRSPNRPLPGQAAAVLVSSPYHHQFISLLVR
jgi:hypothetical protein